MKLYLFTMLTVVNHGQGLWISMVNPVISLQIK